MEGWRGKCHLQFITDKEQDHLWGYLLRQEAETERDEQQGRKGNMNSEKQLSSGWPSSGGGETHPPGASSREHLHVQHANLLAFTSTSTVCYIWCIHHRNPNSFYLSFPAITAGKSWWRLEKSPKHMRRTCKILIKRPRAGIQPRTSSLETKPRLLNATLLLITRNSKTLNFSMSN